MRHPSQNHKVSPRVIAIMKEYRVRAAARLRSLRGWVAVVLLCAGLGGVSLAVRTRMSASKEGRAFAPGATRAGGPVSVPAASPVSLKAASSPSGVATNRASASAPAIGKSNQPAKDTLGPHIRTQVSDRSNIEANESVLQKPLRPAIEAPAESPEGVGENSDISRARGSWFFDQRAYPIGRIPADGLQKAIEERGAMRARQRATSPSGLGANAIISFPGDALWHLMGPQPVDEPFSVNTGFPTASGRVTAIAVDPTNPAIVYIGAAAGGVWKTTDSGTHWTPLTDSQPSLAVGSIAIDPNSCSPGPCQTIYVGTGEDNFNGDAFYGVGILKSTNAGASWTVLGTSVFAGPFSARVGGAQIGAISVQPGSGIVLAAAFFFDGNDPNGGIYRSTDGGATWTQVTGATGAAGTGVVFESAGTNAWAALGDIFSPSPTNNGIWKSTDSGATWTKQTGTGANVLPISNVGRITLGYASGTSGAAATVYAAIADSSSTSTNLLGLFKTVDGGANWTSVTGPGGGFCNSQCSYDMVVGVDPTNANNVVLGGGAFNNNSSTVWRSINGGGTWTDITLGSTNVRPHVDTHALVFSANGATLYDGNDGGMWRTDSPLSTPPLWVNLNATLSTIQFYPGPSAGISDDNSGYGGTQDNDTEIFSGTLDWTNVFACGDGGFTAVDTNIPTTIYTTCDKFARVVKKSVFNGQVLAGPNPSFVNADSGINTADRMQFIPPLTIDESNPSTLYFGTFQVYQTTDGASTWHSVSPDLTGGGNAAITSIDVAHSNSSLILAGTSDGKIWETLAGGGFWTEIDNLVPRQLPPRHVTAVRTKRGDSTGQIAYVTFSGFGACAGCGATPGHVFKTTNGGVTWVNISGDLPDIPVNDLIVFHQGNPTFDALYIATDVGVFSCTNPEAAVSPCANWTVIGDGLPNSPVLGLAMRRSSRILRAATHGRSMWEIQLTDVNPAPLAFLSSVTPATAFVGDATRAVTLSGVNFSSSTAVQFNGATTGVTTTFVSTTQLNVTLDTSLFPVGGVFPITLTDPAGVDPSSTFGSGGGAPFTVMNPILTATNMSPNNTTAFAPVTLTFTGTNFVSSPNNPTLGTKVTFNNFPLSGGTASAGGTSFSIQVPAQFLTTTGVVNVTITNPVPGGGPTPPVSFLFTINPATTIAFNPNPITLSAFLGTTSPVLNVAIINQTASAVTITLQSITGTNLANFSFAAPTSGTSCNFPTSGQSGSGTITLTANGGTCNFGITYTAATPPGNAVSNATLNVTDNAAGSPQAVPIQGTPIPPIVVLGPVNFGNIAIGTTSPTMNATLANGTNSSINVTSTFTITGTNQADFQIVPFVSNGDGNPACPTSVPFPLPSGAACDVSLTFKPSAPPQSETATLNVTASVPVTSSNPNLFGVGVEITSISPSIVATGGPAFTLTVNGGGFASSAVVNVNGNARLTTFVNATQLLASIPASDIATAGSLAISVTTPLGGATSEPKTLVVAEAPSATNDNVNFATVVAPSATPFRTTQDTTHATAQLTAFTGSPATPIDPTPCATGSTAKSVWFQFTPTVSGKVVADTRFSSYATNLSSWTISTPLPSSTATFAPVACNTLNVPAAGSSPAQSLITFPVAANTTYYVMVSDATPGPAVPLGGTLTFSLDFAASPAPGNDDNSTPTPIAAAPFSGSVNAILATANTNGHADPTLPVGCATGAASSGQANSVWYSFTAPGNGTIIADTLTSPYDTILNVTSGSPAGAQIACNNDAALGIAQSQVSFAATSGTQYFFMVSAFLGDGGTTNFHLTFTPTVGPVASLTPSPVPFGNQRVNTTGSPVTVTLTNSGTATLTLAAANAVTISGTNASDFTIAAGTTCTNNANVAASGGTCVINLTFKPGASGARTATLNVVDNANPSPQSVTLNGAGIAPIATVTPNPLPFGNQRKGTTSAALTVTVKNTGTDTLNLAAASAVMIGGANGGDFANAAGTTCANNTALAVNATCIVNITFTPSTAAAEAATLTITDDSNAIPGSNQVVNLTGTGIFPQAAATPNPLAFGNVPENTTSAPLTATLTNSGTDTLHLAASNAVVISGANAADFSIASGTTCINSVAVAANGGTCIINITFTPSTAAAEAASLTITDDASPTTQVVSLTGTGTAASVALSPSPATFGNQRKGTTSAPQTVTLTNSGNGSVQLAAANAVSLGGTNAADFAVTGGTCFNSLTVSANGGTCTITVTFTPSVLGGEAGTVTVAFQGGTASVVDNLTGTGVFPQATPTPSPLAFGNQRKGTTSAQQTLTLTNGGTDTLHLAAASAVAISGANAADFAIVAAGTTCTNSASVAPNGGTCVVKLTFTPSTTAAEAASLTFSDDASPTTQVVSLTGTGTSPIATVTPNPLPFGNQRKGTTSAALTVTVKNTGTDTLNLAAASAVMIGGANGGDFANAAGTTCANNTALAVNATCIVNITFTPSTAAAEAATLTIIDDSNAVPGSNQVVNLIGTGIFPQAAATPSTLPFGTQPKGVQSAPQTATLTNAGTDTLHLAASNAVAISGPNASDFGIAATSTCTNGLAVAANNGSCVVNITFTPSTTSAESATLTITDDASPTTQSVSLTGTGTSATLILSPNPLAFGNQRQGTTSAPQTVTLTNSGNASVQLTAANAVSLGGANAADFAVTGGTCVNSFTVSANGGTCTVTMTFTPSALGAEAATVTVAFQGGPPSAGDNLTGAGVFPQASPTPSPLNFGNQVVNTTSGAQAITLSNPGTDTLHLAASNAVTISGTNAADFAIAAGTSCANSAAVAPNASCLINVTFTPGALNSRTATVTITDDASPTTQLVTLNGTGTNPAPAIAMLSPNSTIAGGAAFLLTITGTGFVSGATVNFGSNPALTPATITSTQITATIPAADIAAAGNVNVTVTNPAPGGGTSPAAAFTVNNPAPTLTSISPTSGVLNQSVNLTLTGTNFVAGSVVNFGTNADSGGVVSNNGATLTITIPASQLNAAGPLNVTVTNPAPGGGTTTAQPFTVNNPVPTLASIAPTSGLLNQSVNLVLTGANFITGSVVNFGANADNGAVVSNNGTTLTITIPAAQLNAAGQVNVTVTNSGPGGGTSGAQTFTINNPLPTITTLSPTNTVAGGISFVLTVNGTSFVATSQVNFNGGAKPTTFVSSTQVTATISAADIANGGVVNVTVTNPGPGGGTSSAAQFTINNAQPTLSSLSPTNTLAGSAAFVLTVNGNSFVSGATVGFNGSPKTTTFVSNTQLTAQITGADIAKAGTFNVTVTNPPPSVGPSLALTFTVNNPVPTITGATAGGANHAPGGTGFTLTVNGTNFVSTSVVNFGNKAETTTLVSATQVTATIPAVDVSTAGSVNVTVTNPAPGGGTTPTSSAFTVDGYTLTGPAAAVTVKAGVTATIPITITPTANGFANQVTFGVTGLPAHASLTPISVTPGNTATTVNLMITTTGNGSAPPTPPSDYRLPPMLRFLFISWAATLLAGLYMFRLMRRAPRLRRYAALIPLALLLVSGAALAGCAGGSNGTPVGTSQLTVTATSGSFSQSTQATLTVQ